MTDTISDILWCPRTLDDVADLDEQPVAMEPAAAQQWCNFVVWTPQPALPYDARVTTGTLRREAPPGRVGNSTAGRTPWSENNPSAYRFELSSPTCRVRVKEFLYDWAFPALEHPSLWGSPTRVMQLDSGRVVWIGIDYAKNVGASVRLERTMIEISVLDGETSDAELCALVAALEPADPAVAERIGRTPFAQLSYWARRPEATMLHVPIGLWNFRRSGRDHEGRWTAKAAEVTSLLGQWGLPAELADLAADSAATFGREEDRAECEVIYSGGRGRNHEIRLLVQQAGRGRLVIPSEREDHPGHFEEAQIGGTPVQVACVDAAIGPWDAVWHDAAAGLDVKMTTTAAPTFNRDWLEGAVTALQGFVRGGRND